MVRAPPTAFSALFRAAYDTFGELQGKDDQREFTDQIKTLGATNTEDSTTNRVRTHNQESKEPQPGTQVKKAQDAPATHPFPDLAATLQRLPGHSPG